MKVRIAIFLTIIMIMGVLPGFNPTKAVYATGIQDESSEDVTIVASGYWVKEGEILTWTFDSEGVFVVSGIGEMENYYPITPWEDYKGDIKELVINEGITSVGTSTFAGCRSIMGELVIPESVIKIKDHAFSHCSGFTGELVIPHGVTSIGDSAFNGCSGFTGDLVIPEGVESIGAYAFDECSGFDGELVIPESVTNIEWAAFAGCSGFTGDLVIPEGVENIGVSAFANCSGFDGELEILDGVVNIENGAFCNCSGFTGDLVIPEGVEGIGGYAFFGCSGLTLIDVPDSVTKIGPNAFPDTEGFILVVVPDSYAETYARENNIPYKYQGQLTVTIKNSNGVVVNTIYVDEGSILAEPEPSEKKDGYTFLGFYNGNTKFDFSKPITRDITLIEKWQASEGNTYNVGYIYVDSKSNLRYRILKTERNDRRVECLGKKQGKGRTINIPSQVIIGNDTYKVTSIAKSAFKNNKTAIKVKIGNNVQSIGKNAFRGCKKLKKIIIKSKKLKKVGRNAFKGIKSNAKIKVPSARLKAYKRLLKNKGQGKRVIITK